MLFSPQVGTQLATAKWRMQRWVARQPHSCGILKPDLRRTWLWAAWYSAVLLEEGGAQGFMHVHGLGSGKGVHFRAKVPVLGRLCQSPCREPLPGPSNKRIILEISSIGSGMKSCARAACRHCDQNVGLPAFLVSQDLASRAAMRSGAGPGDKSSRLC